VEGAGRFEDLVVWQLSVELRDRIVTLTREGRIAKDFKFCAQIRDASSSAPRNIAEGFGRFKPKPFAQFLRIARGSLDETRNHLLDGQRRRYFDDEEVSRLVALQNRASAAITGLIKYLESCDPAGPPWTRTPDTKQHRPH
jgi:four helix bundle protein